MEICHSSRGAVSDYGGRCGWVKNTYTVHFLVQAPCYHSTSTPLAAAIALQCFLCNTNNHIRVCSQCACHTSRRPGRSSPSVSRENEPHLNARTTPSVPFFPRGFRFTPCSSILVLLSHFQQICQDALETPRTEKLAALPTLPGSSFLRTYSIYRPEKHAITRVHRTTPHAKRKDRGAPSPRQNQNRCCSPTSTSPIASL